MSWGQEAAWQAQPLPGMDCPAGRGLFIRRGLFIYRALAGRCQAWLGTPGCQGGCRRGRCKGGRVYHPPRGGPCVPPQGGRATGVAGADMTTVLQDYVCCGSMPWAVPVLLVACPSPRGRWGCLGAGGLRCTGPAGL